MILPTQRASGLAASNLLQSVLDTIDRRQVEEDDKRLQRPKEDAILTARLSNRDANRKAQEKIASAMFDVQHQDPNKVKIDLAERLGRKLGLDVDDLKARSSLGAALEGAIKGLTFPERQKLEKELGLDKLKLSLQDLVEAIKQPELKKDGSGAEDDKKIKDPFLDELKVKQRLEDMARQKTVAEKKAAVEEPRDGRVVDDETKAEDKQDLQAAEALSKLDDVVKTQKTLKTVTESGKTRDADGTASDLQKVDLLLLAGATAERAKPEAAGLSPEVAKDKSSSDGHGGDNPPLLLKADAGADTHQATKSSRFAVSIDEIGLYSYLARAVA